MSTASRLLILRQSQARELRRHRANGNRVLARMCVPAFARVRINMLRRAEQELRAKRAVAALISSLLLHGCGNVRPIAEYSHISHATQHVDGRGNNLGCNMLGGGLRFKPHAKLQIDLLESYSMELCQGPYHETFTGRVTWEF